MGNAQIKQTRSNSTNYQLALAQFFTFAALCEDGTGEAGLLSDTIRESVVTAARELAYYNDNYKRSRELSAGGVLGRYMTIIDREAARSEVARLNGSVTSEAKAEAARVNGAATRFTAKHESPEAAAEAHRTAKRESARRKRAEKAVGQPPAKRGRPKKAE